MMTKERLEEIKDVWANSERSTMLTAMGVPPVIRELIAEVERLQHLEEAVNNGRLFGEMLRQRREQGQHISHVGPPDTTPCVQVPVADARDGGL